MRKWSAWVVVLGAALLVGGIATGTSGARTPRNGHAGARADAQRILASLRLPPGAIKVAGDPSSPRLLGAAPSTPLVPKLVDVHEFWRLPGNLREVLAWVEAHVPAGSGQGMSGESAGPGTVRTAWVGFGFPPIRGARGYRALIVTVAHAAGGGTALRADAQLAPLARRTAAERIPTRVTAITISEQRLGSSSAGPWTVTNRAKVHRIVALVNALPLGPAGPIACPADMGPYVTLKFTKAGRPVATVIADGSGCGFVGLSIRRHREPFLAGGPKLIGQVGSLLGVRL